MQTIRDQDLRDSPNKYAGKQGVEFQENQAHFTGYQDFVLDWHERRITPCSQALTNKRALLAGLFTPARMAQRTVLDLGGNNGFFAIEAILNGARSSTVVDIDPDCILSLDRLRSHAPEIPLEAHRANVDAWEQPADAVLAFALVHWIYSCTAKTLSLEVAIDKIASLTRDYLLIEWVDPADPLILEYRHTATSAPGAAPYEFDVFRRALEQRFTSVSLVGELSPTRRIFLASKGPIHDLSWSAPLIYPKETLLSSRVLWSVGSTDYWSRVYAVDGFIYKQTSPELGRRELEAMRLIDDPAVLPGEQVEETPEYSLTRVVRSEGVTLDQAYVSSILDRDATLKLIGRLLDLVTAMRSVGVMHRDLHPENILVTPEGEPRLIDFGWAVAPGLPDLTPPPLGTNVFLSASRTHLTVRPPEGSGDDLYAVGKVAVWLNQKRDPDLEFLGHWLGCDDARLRLTEVDVARAWLTHATGQSGKAGAPPSKLETSLAKLGAQAHERLRREQPNDLEHERAAHQATRGTLERTNAELERIRAERDRLEERLRLTEAERQTLEGRLQESEAFRATLGDTLEQHWTVLRGDLGGLSQTLTQIAQRSETFFAFLKRRIRQRWHRA